MTTIYLSGPISDMPDENRPAFEAAKQALINRGYEVITPFDVNPKKTEWVPAMRRDVAAMLTLCDECWLLPGWEQSSGSVGEASIARWLGMPIRFFDVGGHAPCVAFFWEQLLIDLPAPGALWGSA